MKLEFNLFNLLVLFGALQGLIFGIILLFNRKHPGARFLAVFMLVLAYNGLETFNWSGHLDAYIIFFDLFPFIMIYALGPSLYLYVLSLLYPENKLSRKRILLHYAPAMFQLVFRASFAIYYLLWTLKIVHDTTVPQWLYGIYHIYSEPLSVILFLIYLCASVYAFRKARVSHTIKGVSKEGQRVIMKWVRILLIFMTVLGIAWPLTVLAPYVLDIPYDVHYYPIELALVLFIYWIAFAGYHRTKTIYRQGPAFAGQAMAPATADRHLAQLQQAMEKDRLYLDPELNLTKMAAHTGLGAKIISTILNRHARQSFNDFVNHYRVREVREKLLDPKKQHLTISGIALECGFNSQATFQRAFKGSTGMSPREYLALQLEKTG